MSEMDWKKTSKGGYIGRLILNDGEKVIVFIQKTDGSYQFYKHHEDMSQISPKNDLLPDKNLIINQLDRGSYISFKAKLIVLNQEN